MNEAAHNAGDAPPLRKLPRNVLLLSCTSLLNDIASEMLFPLLPMFLINVLGGTKAQLGLIDGFAESISSLLKLWSGGRSDAAGKRKGFVLFGYSLAAIARPLIGLTWAPWQLFALRTLDRVGKGIRTAPRDALIADSTEPDMHGQAFGFHRAMDHLGAAIGPLLAFVFLLIWPGQLRTLFLLAIVPAIPIIFIVVFSLHEPATHREVKAPFRPGMFPFSANFRLYLVSLVVFTLGNSSDSFLLVRAEELGVPTAWLPILWGTFHIAKSGGNVIAGRWVNRLGARPMIWLGWFVYAAVYLAFGLATAAWHVWALFFIYAVFYSLTEPAEKTLVAAIVGPERKGLAFGWFNLTIGIGALPASALFGWIYEHYGALPAFGIGAGLAFVAAILLAGVRNESPPSSS
jgi:MFS family permease